MPTSEKQLQICLSGDIDHHKASRLRREIDGTLLEHHPQLLELNFKDVTFMDSSGVGLIMGRYRLITGWNGQLRVTEVSPQIKKLMHLAGLDSLPIFSDSTEEGANQ